MHYFRSDFAKTKEAIMMQDIASPENVKIRAMAGRQYALQHCRQAGFSMIELVLVVLLACIVGGFGVLGMTAILPGMRANDAMYMAVSQLRRGRSLAISQRRSVQLQFLGDNQIRLLRNDWPPPGTTELSTKSLGSKSKFILFAGVPDSPDGFGNIAWE